MISTRSSVVLIRASREISPVVERELSGIHVIHVQSVDEARSIFPEVGAVILDLGDSGELDEVTFGPLLTEGARYSRLRWFFISTANGEWLKGFSRQMRSLRLSNWTWLKAPLLPGELAQALQTHFEHARAQEREVRASRFEDVRKALRGFAHELGNVMFRVVSRVDLALAQSDAEKLRKQVEKLSEAVMNGAQLIQDLQSFVRAPFAPVSLKVSSILESVAKASPLLDEGGVQWSMTPADPAEMQCEVDQELLSYAFIEIIEALISSCRPPTLRCELEERLHHGYPGIFVRFRCPEVEHSPKQSETDLNLRFGLKIPIAAQIVAVHGGELSVDRGPCMELSVWLPYLS